MPGVFEYIEQFGNRSFFEREFGDADNLTLSQVAYLDFEKVVSPSFDDAPKSFAEASNELFALHDYVHKPIGLVIPNDASVNSMRMAIQKRFSEMKIWAAQTAYTRLPALQFAAMTFLLPTGETVIAFRGTDDTIAGWIEDINVYAQHGIPSHALAAAYLAEAAAHTEGDLILCGHSKGGHLALYAAVYAAPAVRARIKAIYNNDGPGFDNYDLFSTDGYRELLPYYHHFVPHASVIGMMLAHDFDYKAIFSTKKLGIFQHDMSSWQIVNGKVITRPDVDTFSKLLEIVLAELTSRISDAQRDDLNTVIDKLYGAAKAESLTELFKKLPRETQLLIAAWLNIPQTQRKGFQSIFHPFPKIVSGIWENIRQEDLPQTFKNASALLHRIRVRIA